MRPRHPPLYLLLAAARCRHLEIKRALREPTYRLFFFFTSVRFFPLQSAEKGEGGGKGYSKGEWTELKKKN